MRSFNVEVSSRFNVKMDVADDFCPDDAEIKNELSLLLYKHGVDSQGVDDNGNEFKIGEMHELELDEVDEIQEIK